VGYAPVRRQRRFGLDADLPCRAYLAILESRTHKIVLIWPLRIRAEAKINSAF